MKFRRNYAWILIVVFILSLLGSMLVLQNHESNNKILVFITVGIDRSQAPNEVSSYELERASEHFSDVLLGWTLEPSFRRTFTERAGPGYTYTGQRQEKQNLLFTLTNGENMLTEESLAVDGVFLNLLSGQLFEYNQSTHAGYVLALTRSTFVEDAFSSGRVILGVVLFSLITVGFLLTLWEYVYASRR